MISDNGNWDKYLFVCFLDQLIKYTCVCTMYTMQLVIYDSIQMPTIIIVAM